MNTIAVPVRKLLCVIFGLALLQPAFSQNEASKDIKRTQESSNTSDSFQLTAEQENSREAELHAKTIALASEFERLMQEHLAAADKLDVSQFQAVNDRLETMFEAEDALMLEAEQLAQWGAYGTRKTKEAIARQYAKAREEYRASKFFNYKSSAVFYLCFGLPEKAAHYGRMCVAMAEADSSTPGNLRDALPDVLSNLGAACCWSGDYQAAERYLKRGLSLNTHGKWTYVTPGQTYNAAGQNPFAANYLANAYIARGQIETAIASLQAARRQAPSEELRGTIDTLLALVYTLDKNVEKSKQHIVRARTELQSDRHKAFPALAQESLGITEALSGNFERSQKILSEAIAGLEASPLKLGTRLEAGQALLWRSYCRTRLGDTKGAAEDRSRAMVAAEEAPHLITLAKLLDQLFGVRAKYTSTERAAPDRWAIVVGVGNFADPRVTSLQYSANDARDVTTFLVENAGFKPDHVRTLVNAEATRANFTDCLGGNWLAGAKPDDVVFVFVSSHGTPAYADIGATNFVVLYDTSLDRLFETSLPMQSIVRLLRSKHPKQRTFIVLDTCYSGGLGAPGQVAKSDSNVDPEMMRSSLHQLFVSSSEKGERSWESKRYANSVFTRQFVDELKERQGYNDFHSVFAQIRQRVSKEVSADYPGNTQTPRLAGVWSGKQLVKSNATQGAP